ncbi:M48 family metalloprotease [Streptomyces sp. NPDC002588]|uniref:M48 family metalloprotease n=1 Tax=Streptomyces sp. NPDC002588 TaxID=3154419 RepID=UPI003322F0FE
MTGGAAAVGGVAPPSLPPGPAAMTGPSLRARTDLRFAVLVAAVLASSVVAFSVVSAALPSAEWLSRHRVDPCLARIDPATAWITGESDQLNTRVAMANACMRPYVLHEIGWIATGLAAEVAVAVLLFALHPWWPRITWRPASGVGSGPLRRLAGSVRLPQRSRKLRLTGRENADVLEELDALARKAGLSRLPLWLIDPYATTAGGRAYGLPGRPRVCLNVGLLVRFDRDLAGFRAVVRHELAHHRHRDVGRTYLTIALWWSFVTTALAPCVLLSLYPRALFGAAEDWPGSTLPGIEEKPVYRLAALAVLSAVAYLARNMILRARELHADALAHTWDATRSSLPRMVAALPWPSARSVWRWLPAGWRRRAARAGTHPSPERRVAAMADPARLLRTGTWETAALGLLAGLALDNLSLLTGMVSERFVTVGLTLLALPFGVVLTLALAAALAARNAAPSPDSSPDSSPAPGSAPVAGAARDGRARRGAVPPGRDLFVLPAALTGGLVCSRAISLVAADTTVIAPTLGQYALIGLVHLAILLPLALWMRSVRRALSPRALSPHSLRPDGSGAGRGPHTRLVIATAGVVWGPLLALWHARGWDPDALTTTPLRAVPAVGQTIGWYSALTGRLGDAYFYFPLLLLRATPLLPVGLVLVWAVPLVAAARRRGHLALREGVGRALAVGAAAGLTSVACGIVLPYAARGALPPEVRRISGPPAVLGALSFLTVHADTYMAVAALLQAAAAVGTVLVCRRLRPVLVPLAVTVTAALGTLGFYVSRGTALCVAVTDAAAGVCGAREFLPGTDVADRLHEAVAWGAVAALPAGLLAAAVTALSAHRRRRPDGVPDTAHEDTPRRPVLLRPALGFLAALVLAGAAAGVRQDHLVWRSTASTAAARPPSNGQDARQASGPSGSSDRKNDPCLVGTWRASPARQRLVVDGSPVWLTGDRGTWTFRPDGILIIDYGKGVSQTGTLHGRAVVLHMSGSAGAHYRTADGTIGYYGSAVRRPGDVTLRVAETYVVRQKATASLTPDHYTCAGDVAHLLPPSPATDAPYDLTLTRLR